MYVYWGCIVFLVEIKIMYVCLPPIPACSAEVVDETPGERRELSRLRVWRMNKIHHYRLGYSATRTMATIRKCCITTVSCHVPPPPTPQVLHYSPPPPPWLAKFVPTVQPIESKIQTKCHLLARVFPRLAPVTYSEF